MEYVYYGLNKPGIYVLTNSSLQGLVKIGYTKDLNGLIEKLNGSDSTPEPFEVYAFYEKKSPLTDKKIMSFFQIGDKFIGNGFYKMEPQEIYDKLIMVAKFSETENRLSKRGDFEKTNGKDQKGGMLNDVVNGSVNTTETAQYVWYACYGSNLDAERFQEYLDCCENDNTPAREVRWKEYKGSLFFGGKKTHHWREGGTAFYRLECEGSVIMKLYRITPDQFEAVKKGEGRRYQNQIELGMEDGYKVYTLTCDEGVDMESDDYIETSPSDKYYDVIVKGLVEGEQKDQLEAQKYINQWF